MSADIKNNTEKNLKRYICLDFFAIIFFPPFFFFPLAYNTKKNTDDMMKPIDIHMKIKGNCACWNSIQCPWG